MEQEIWKDIEGYEGRYKISNFGRVKSIIRKNNILLRQGMSGPKKNYYRVCLLNNKKIKHIRVHRLVAQAFIPNIENKPHINHIDGNPRNNNVYNLEWCTPSENILHAYRTGLLKPPILGKFGIFASRHIAVLQYDLQNNIIKEWNCIRDILRDLKIDSSSITKVCKNKRLTAGGFIWRYKED